MATEMYKKIVHDWTTGELVETEVEMTQEEIDEIPNHGDIGPAAS